MKRLIDTNSINECPDFKIDIMQEEVNLNQEYQQNWEELKQFLDNLYQFNGNIDPSVPYQYVYELVQEIGQLEYYQNLHNDLVQYFKNYFENMLTPFKNIDVQQQDKFLDQMEDIWKQVRRSIKIITQIFKYFETGFLFKTRTQSIETFILQEFSKQFSNYQQIKLITSQNLLKIIENRRYEKNINEEQLKQLTEMFIALELYDTVFEVEFLDVSTQYFTKKSNELNSSLTIQELLPIIHKIYTQENELVQKFLSKQTGRKLITIFQEQFILNKLEQILDQFGILLEKLDFDNLRILFQFLQQVEKIDFLKVTWRNQIKVIGAKIINLEDKSQIAPELLKFLANLDKIQINCFENNKILHNHQKYAIEDILNLKVNQLAEITCKHIDQKLTKTNKSMQDEENIKQDVEESLQLFRYLPSKDIFEAFFNKRFIKRLLLEQSYSIELELHVISRLKQQCGEQYTKIVEDIYSDIKLSKEINQEYQQYIEKRNDHKDYRLLNITIISSASWPNDENEIKENQIQQFSNLTNHFNEYYKENNNGKNLKWQYELSSVEMYGYFDKKYTFILSFEQALVLSLFNQKDQWTYQELGEALKLTTQSLKAACISLYAMKQSQRLLLKTTGEEKKITEGDIFIINTNYTNKKIRVKVNTVQKQESQQQVNDIMERVIHDRQYVLDASIVKIMKLKKKLSHKELSEEIFKDLKLPLNQKEIKTRIDSLLERGYIVRDEDIHSIYHYQA